MNIHVNGVALNVQERGDRHSARPALVFLHYFAGSSRAWLPVMDLLAESFQCVAPDLRGFGESEAPASGYTVEDYADDTIALIGALGLTRYVLVGHSMGGKIALAVAARAPEGLVSLILLAPSPLTPEPMDDAERVRLIHGHAKLAEAEATIRKITALPLSAYFFKQAVEDSLRSSLAAWNAWLQHGSRENLLAMAPCVADPVLVVAGECDPVLPEAIMRREVLDRLSEGRMTILPKSGHLSPLEAPSFVAELIVRALI